MKKIMKLTPEQETMLPVYRDKWIAIGLSTNRIDRQKHDAAVGAVYQLTKLQPPRMIYLPCPLSGALAASIYQAVTSSSAANFPVSSEVRSAVCSTVDSAVRSAARSAVDFAVSSAVGSEVRSAVGSAVDSAVDSAVYSAVRSAVNLSTDSTNLKWIYWLWGNQWAGYAAWAEFFMRECGVAVNIDCIEMIKHGHYIWPFENVCFASERPVAIHVDDQGRNHSATGPSVVYSSGWGPYCWHGVVIPPEWLDGKTLTPQMALTHENLEQRRAACEILGWAQILKKLNAKTIQKNSNPQIGELLEVELPDIGKEKFLRVTCGTGREFALPVPPEMRTALEANAWTYGVAANDYQPEVRT